ncbi:DUF2945 domain-containing protein [Euzebya rosea]|uniref:DUF2945 domain-containing protein n=1 Tax=Euzebya rosea TaxID=2052804 RepID=UPI000D3E85C1|nr:DUF2945 domain-containing protein [Euzebya rosea]
MADYRVGQDVEWDWGDGTGSGTVKQIYTERVEKTIAGTEVVRDADEDNPAYLVEQDDGDRVLKSQSELRKA